LDWKKWELFKGEKQYIMNEIRLGQKCSTVFTTDGERLLVSKDHIQYSPPSLVCDSYKNPSRSRKKGNAATKRLMFSANRQKVMSDKHTQD